MHMISLTRLSRFSACDIENLGMGLGRRLLMFNVWLYDYMPPPPKYIYIYYIPSRTQLQLQSILGIKGLDWILLSLMKIFNFNLWSLGLWTSGFGPSIVRTYQNAWHKLQLTCISGQPYSNERTFGAPLSTGFFLWRDGYIHRITFEYGDTCHKPTQKVYTSQSTHYFL